MLNYVIKIVVLISIYISQSQIYLLNELKFMEFMCSKKMYAEKLSI